MQNVYGEGQITTLLSCASGGDRDAAGRLFPLVYAELRTIARRAMRHERSNHTLQPTAVVHEAYVRLLGGGAVPSRDRAHFFALASQVIRRILVDHARKKARLKRGSARAREALTDNAAATPNVEHDDRVDVIELDDALAALQQENPRHARVVEMRFFGGLTTEEVSGILGTSARTVERDWQFARAWLFRRLNS